MVLHYVVVWCCIMLLYGVALCCCMVLYLTKDLESGMIYEKTNRRKKNLGFRILGLKNYCKASKCYHREYVSSVLVTEETFNC